MKENRDEPYKESVIGQVAMLWAFTIAARIWMKVDR